MTWMQQVAVWWLDYLVLATVLLAAVLIAGSVIRQPVQRMALAWSSNLALLMLAVCCALPVWPKLSIVPGSSSVAAITVVLPASAEMQSAPESMSVAEFMSRKPKASPVESLSAVDLGKHKVHSAVTSTHTIDGSTIQIPYFVYASAALLCGAALTLTWLAYGHLRAQRICNRAEVAPDFAQRELRTLIATRGPLPRLLVSRDLSTAGAIGLWRPAILLPADAIELQETSNTNGGQGADMSLRAILAHEWAHIERGDLWLLAIRRLLLVVLFAHPLYWLSRRRVLADQEMLADWAAAERCGRHNYAECMVAWARQKPRVGAKLDWALGIWERPSELTQRITLLLNDKLSLRTACSRRWRIGNAAAITLVAGCLSLLTLNPTPQAKAESSEATPPVATAVIQPTAKKPAQVALPTVSIVGACTDEFNQSITNVHVMLFRVGDLSHGGRNFPVGRTKILLTASQTGAGKREMESGFGSGIRSATGPQLLAETNADAAGRFRFADFPVDEKWQSNQNAVWVVAQSPSRATALGFANVSKKPDGKLSVEAINLALGQAESLRGRITNGDGRPVAGAVVWCASVCNLSGPRPGIMCAVTDANGRYEVNDLTRFDVRELPAQSTGLGMMMKEVSLTASVEHPDYADGVIEYTKVPATADLVLQRPANLRGRVTLAGSGGPATGARVLLRDKDSLGGAVVTDRDGNFLIRRVLPGKYTVETELSGRLKTSQSTELAVGDNRLDLQLKTGGVIKGRVIDNATGKPAQFDRSMSIDVYALPAGKPLENANKGGVNADGTFSIAVEPGRNTLRILSPQWQLADKPRWTEQGIEVALGETKEIELQLSPCVGGYAELMSESLAADAAVKGEPSSLPPSGPPDMSLELGDPEMDRISALARQFPDELLPAEPMTADELSKILDSVAIVERKTIDGKQCITSIQIGSLEPGSQPNFGESLMLDYSVLAHISEYPHLESLLLVGAPGNDKWLEPLRGHEQLQSLELVWSKNMTAAGVEILTTLPKLKHVGMLGLRLDDDALHQLSRIPKLETATFGGVFTDKGVASLQDNSRLTALALLGFGESKLTDESLHSIGRLKKLEFLEIIHAGGEQPFTDQGLKQLAGLTELKALNIGGKGITDAGLAELRGLKRLKNLDLLHTSVTQRAIEELKKQLPGLKVTQE